MDNKKPLTKKDYSRGSGVPHPVDVNVGKRIKMRRSMLGLSQDKLATKIGLTFQQIQKYERAANRVSASKLFDFAKVLDVPVDYFYQGLGGKNTPATGMADNDQAPFGSDDNKDMPENIDESRMFSKETMDLLREYYSIDDAHKRRDVYNLIKTFAKNMRED